jgi:hypothetical protein
MGRELTLVGGPCDGRTIDLGAICNGDSFGFCPVHGFQFNHIVQVPEEYIIRHDYDIETGAYEGQHKPNLR